MKEYKKFEDFEIGELLSYPCDDLDFHRVAEISKEDAFAIINRYPKAKHFINKLAMVIFTDDINGSIVAVYQHDFRFWIIKKHF